jgi:TRAP-type transport system periplasmic protein
VGKELEADMERSGFKVLSWAVSWGYRNVVTAKKEVKTAADLKGLKIRTIPTKVFVAAINAMGANATPMNFGEIYTSLQSGVLDGYEHTAATTISFKLNEVACCIAMTRHLMDPTVLVFSLAEWKKFSPAEQAVLQKGADEAAALVRKLAPEREAESLAAVKKLGMKVVDIDVGPLQEAAVKAQDELAKDFGAEALLAQIRKQ